MSSCHDLQTPDSQLQAPDHRMFYCLGIMVRRELALTFDSVRLVDGQLLRHAKTLTSKRFRHENHPQINFKKVPSTESWTIQIFGDVGPQIWIIRSTFSGYKVHPVGL